MFTGLRQQFDFGDSLLNCILPHHHDLVKLKSILDWSQIDRIYRECFPSRRGRGSKQTELVLGLLILKHLYRRSHRQLIEELHVNTAFMYFCSISPLEVGKTLSAGKRLIDHSTVIKAIHRLGSERVEAIERQFRDQLIGKGIVTGRRLFVDTTSLEANIRYPTEVGLLTRVVEHAEMVVQKVIRKKELAKTAVIEAAHRIAKVYYSAGKKSQELLASTSRQLLSLAKDTMATARTVYRRCGRTVKERLAPTVEKLTRVGGRIIEQVERKLAGEAVSDKIVSYYEEHARPLPKGKVGKPCEFGTKLRLQMNGDGYITNYRLYQGNPADVGMLEEAVDEHAARFGPEFQQAAADRGFYDSATIETLQQRYPIQLVIPAKKGRGQPLSAAEQRLYDKRSAIEACISEGKRCVGMDKSTYRGWDGDQIWASMSVLALNIRHLLRDLRTKPSVARALGMATG